MCLVGFLALSVGFIVLSDFHRPRVFCHQRMAEERTKTVSKHFSFILFFFPSRLPMDLPTVQLLCLEQGDGLLEDHTRDFIDLDAKHTNRTTPA